jgi:aminoglycoside phosphotransferase (APT) family kinase protein
MSDFDEAALARFCQAQFGVGHVTELSKLSGGASMESWRFKFQDRPMILRLRPRHLDDEPSDSEVALLSLTGQADLIAQLHAGGLAVPEILATLPAHHVLGDGFIMACVQGEALPGRILRKPEFESARHKLSAQCAQQLARMHQMPTSQLSHELIIRTPEQLLQEQHDYYRAFGSVNPVFEAVFSWLQRHCPNTDRLTLVHADFRIGNLMVMPQEGLSAILDWELSHIGDPMRDVSFICTPSWRFGHYHLGAGGFATLDTWLADYEAASGQAVDKTQFNWWLMFNTLWWGVTCMRFGSAFKDHSVRTVERAVIGRRVSEVEVDLLLLLDDYHGYGVPVSHPPISSSPEGDVSYSDVALGVREWHEQTVLLKAQGHQQFESRVALNALGITTRALLLGPCYAERQRSRLAAMDMTESELNAALADDYNELRQQAIWEHVVLTALERIDIDQPHYAGADVARERWLSAR